MLSDEILLQISDTLGLTPEERVGLKRFHDWFANTKRNIAPSSNGRTVAFEAAYLGSNPRGAANSCLKASRAAIRRINT